MKKIISKTLIYLVLSLGAVVVLLPLFWMLLTAFKQPGQALKFNFLPKTAFESIEYRLDPAVKNMTVFEYQNKAAVSVAVAGSMNGWDQNKDAMKNDNGTWTINLPLKAGGYEYKFVVNGIEWVADPDNKNQQNGNSLITVKAGITTNKILSNQTAISDNKLVFKYVNPRAISASVVVKGGEDLKLVKDASDVWTGEMPATGIGKMDYTFKYSIPFMEGVKEIYTINNFSKVLFNKDFPFASFFMNSLAVAGGCAFFTVIICTMGGYAFAKKKFFMKDQLFLLLLATMMIPGMIYMVPQFAIVSHLHWINSYKAMIIPHLANVFGLFLLKQSIHTIPNSLFEAAKVDGASEIQVFRNIVIPLSFPIIVTLFLLTFLGQWSNFLWQLIVNTPDSALRTLPVGLALFKGQYAIEWESMMAGACFSIVPIAILFLFAQKFFIEGMTSGAVKG